MEHLVRFTTAEGRDGHHYATGLDEALKFVERLRNTEDVSDVRVWRLQPVPIEFRAYYRVELKSGEGQPESISPPGPEAETPAEVLEGSMSPPADSAPPSLTAVAGDGGRRIFGRS